MTRTARLRCFDRGYRKLTGADGKPTGEPPALLEAQAVAEAICLEEFRNGPARRLRRWAPMPPWMTRPVDVVAAYAAG